MDTPTLLGRFAELMHEYGANSPQTENFLNAYKDNQEFVELAAMSRRLKTAFEHKGAWPPVDRRVALPVVLAVVYAAGAVTGWVCCYFCMR